MTWFDAVAILLVILVGWIESVRGFGRAIFDFVGALIAMRLSILVAPELAESVPVFQSNAHAEAFWLAMVFFVFIVLIVVATKFIYQSTLLSLDVMDPLVGGVLGVSMGLMVAHIFLRVLLIAAKGTDFSNIVFNSFMGQELIAFRTYHRVVEQLQNLGNW